jgi:hypothetical protein
MAAMNDEDLQFGIWQRWSFWERGKPAQILGLGISSRYNTLYFDDQGVRFWLSVDCVARVCCDVA